MTSIQTHLCLLCACFILHRARVSDSLNLNTSLIPGSPLTEAEYREFWQLFKPDWKAKYICQIRETFGCQEPRIYHFDLYENHGSLPNGTVCADSKKLDPFPSFCKFALHRCSSHQFYLKRIPCVGLASNVFKETRSLIPKDTNESTVALPKLTPSRLQGKRNEADLSSFLHTQIANLFQLSLRVSDLELTEEASDKKARFRKRRSDLASLSNRPRAPKRLLYEKQQRKILDGNYGRLDHKKKTKT